MEHNNNGTGDKFTPRVCIKSPFMKVFVFFRMTWQSFIHDKLDFPIITKCRVCILPKKLFLKKSFCLRSLNIFPKIFKKKKLKCLLIFGAEFKKQWPFWHTEYITRYVCDLDCEVFFHKYAHWLLKLALSISRKRINFLLGI